MRPIAAAAGDAPGIGGCCRRAAAPPRPLLVTLGGHGGNFWSHWDPFTFGVVAVPLAGKAHD